MIHNATKALALSLLIIQLLCAQTRADKPSTAQEKPLKLRTEEVIVDAVVLDKKNRGVSDLTAADFEIYEDGVKQKILSFRFESSAAGPLSPSTAQAAGAGSAAPNTVNLVSLVFDAQAARDGALRARQAALDYIDSGMGPNDYVAVFGIDLGLSLLSPFTQDKPTLKRAVETFTSRDSKKYGYLAQEVRSELERLVLAAPDSAKMATVDTWVEQDFSVPVPGSTDEGKTSESPSVVISPSTFTIMRNQLNIAMLRTLRIFERYEREVQGRTIVTALLAVIASQQSFPARKTLLLFSEGFAISPSVVDEYRSVISAANRTGVTIYSIDVGGLRLINPEEDAQTEKAAAAQSTMRNRNPELIVGGVSALGRMEEAMRLNAVSNLDELSGDTGGYTIKNTNDVREGLRRISEDLSTYYVLTYSPTNQIYDGKFRRVTVKVVKAGDFHIRARRGYYAFRTLDNSPILPHEVPMIEKSVQSALPVDFPLYAQALHFRGWDGTRVVPIYVELPISALKVETDEKNNTFSARYAILVLVKNQDQQVVRKVGQQYLLRGPLGQITTVQAQPHLFNRIVRLTPGHYTIEAIVRDSLTGKMAGLRLPLDVPGSSDEKLQLSSIVLSRGVNPLTEQQKKDVLHPLYFEGQAYFVPNTREVFRKSFDKNLLLHFSTYPAKSRAQITAAVEFLQNGKTVSQASGQLPRPDATGRIAYLTSFGLENFHVGQYEVRVTVNDGATRISSSASFKVEP